MKKNFVLGRIFGLVVLSLALCGIAYGDSTVMIEFPTVGDGYCSAGQGCGTIPLGGTTANLWTAGDFVTTPLLQNTGLTSLTDLRGIWTYTDNLNFASGASETWGIWVNSSVEVGSFTVTGLNSLPGLVTVDTGILNFADIPPAAGGYAITLSLQNTVPFGGGSVNWVDNGVTQLSGSSGSAVPEPTSLMLMGTAIAGLAMVLRRRLL
jgi:PEP-CTERM motif